MSVRGPEPLRLSLFCTDDAPEASAARSCESLLDAARFADANGLHAVWIPEHGHLHPALLAAALARETTHVRLHGSTAAHAALDPLRLASEWSAIDALSDGRAGLCVVDDGHERLDEETVWRGRPRPPLFVALSAGSERWTRAGERKLGVLVRLVAQDLDQLASDIERYRGGLAAGGHDPARGAVVVLLPSGLMAAEEPFGLAAKVLDAGADELACPIEIGLPPPRLREALEQVVALRDRLAAARASAPSSAWEEDSAPLTLGQESMWFSSLLHGSSRAFTVPSATRLVGPLDPAALAAAFNDVARSQEALRCRVVVEDDVPRQRIRRHVDVDLPVIDVGGRPEDEVVAEEMARESTRSFDLAAGPLWGARLLRFDAEHHLLVLCLHHLIIDMTSMKTLMRQVSRSYAARLSGDPSPLGATPAMAYSAYARRQHELLESPQVDAAIRHWQAYLTPLPPQLVLPTSERGSRPFTGEGTALQHRVDRALAATLAERARTTQVTPFMCIAGAYALALHALSGQDEIVIGTAIVDQPLQFADTIGPFINVLPLRIPLDGASSFADVVQRVRATMLNALEHSAAPFEEVVRRINPPRDPGRNPIFQVSIEFGGGGSFELELPGIDSTTIDQPPSRAASELGLHVWLSDGEIHCNFEYATTTFDDDTIATLVATFDRILVAGLADVDRPLAELVAPQARADARPRDSAPAPPALFCLAHAGGSADSAYREWASAIGDLVRVVPLELAGRGRRVGEAGCTSLRAAASECAARIEAEAGDAPFALFGHSIGGVLAYEIDAALRAHGAGPEAVIVAATPAPSRWSERPHIHDWPEEQFLEAVARYGGLPQVVLDHPPARAFHTAVLRDDFRIIDGYELVAPPHRLAAPLLLLQGGADPATCSSDSALWSRFAEGGVTTRTLPAAQHFFPETHQAETLAMVRGFLARALVRAP